jgi:hypothetical protein
MLSSREAPTACGAKTIARRTLEAHQKTITRDLTER